MEKTRIFLSGVGGQGTLTATTLLARTALDQGIAVTSGEIHGMAQRGGVVESTILLGGYHSPRISIGEADILLGFDPLETLRALPYLRHQGYIFSNQEPILPLRVSMGAEKYPDIDMIREKSASCATAAYFLPCQSLGKKAGAIQCGNIALLGALCSLEIVPFDLEALQKGIRTYFPPKIVDINLHAAQLGAKALH